MLTTQRCSGYIYSRIPNLVETIGKVRGNGSATMMPCRVRLTPRLMDDGSRPHIRAYTRAQASRHQCSCTIPQVDSTRQHTYLTYHPESMINNNGAGMVTRWHALLLPLSAGSPRIHSELSLAGTTRNERNTCELPSITIAHTTLCIRLLHTHSTSARTLPFRYRSTAANCCNCLNRAVPIQHQQRQFRSPITATASCRKQLQLIDTTTTRLSTH
jgi:hypothetical protein